MTPLTHLLIIVGLAIITLYLSEEWRKRPRIRKRIPMEVGWMKGEGVDETDYVYFMLPRDDQHTLLAGVAAHHSLSLEDLRMWGIQVPIGFDPKSDWAMAVYLQAAERGSPAAQFEVGIRYIMGQGVEKDCREGVMWLNKAGHQNYPPALKYYEESCLKEEEIPKDPVEAARWFQKKAKKNYAQAQFELARRYYCGEGVKKNEKKGLYWDKKSADAGYAPAEWLIGMAYEFGEIGGKPNLVKAVEYYRYAAEGGHPGGQFQLASAYHRGRGVQQDLEEAAKWYGKSAESGFASAEFNYGLMLYTGEGGEKDQERGLVFIRKAAAQGDELALAFLRGEMSSIKEDPKKGFIRILH